MEVKHSSEAIWIPSPSMTMPCSLRATVVEALHNPTVGTNIMSEFLAKTLLGKILLVSTNKLFKTPLGLIFECCGIARDMPIKIDKIEVSIDFHIYAILEFDLLIGYPLENLFQEKPSHGRLSEEFGKIASATHPENPMAKHNPKSPTLETVEKVFAVEHESLSFETPCVSCSLLKSS